eukprot:542861_1
MRAIKRWNWNWDGRKAYYNKYLSLNPPVHPNGTKVITLIRHSQYHQLDMSDGDFHKNDNSEITKDGEQQAQITGQRLKCLNMKFDKIYTSAYTRSQQTCKIIVNQLQYNNISQIIIDSDLNEGCPDIMEPLKKHRT